MAVSVARDTSNEEEGVLVDREKLPRRDMKRRALCHWIMRHAWGSSKHVQGRASCRGRGGEGGRTRMDRWTGGLVDGWMGGWTGNGRGKRQWLVLVLAEHERASVPRVFHSWCSRWRERESLAKDRNRGVCDWPAHSRSDGTRARHGTHTDADTDAEMGSLHSAFGPGLGIRRLGGSEVMIYSHEATGARTLLRCMCCTVLSYPVCGATTLSFPVLCCPTLCSAVLSCPVLFCPVTSRPVH